jgi:hypothetical protein
MAGAGILPLMVSLTIANIMMHHVLIDSKASLSVKSFHGFEALHISVSKMQLLSPFDGRGSNTIMSYGGIKLPTTFGTADNFRTDNIADFDLPINAFIGRPVLYRFMVVSHYGYLILKMSSPNGMIAVHADRNAATSAVDKPLALPLDHSTTDQDERVGKTLAPRLRSTTTTQKPSAKGKHATWESHQQFLLLSSRCATQRHRHSTHDGCLDQHGSLGYGGCIGTHAIALLWANVDVIAWQPSNIPGVLGW